MAASAAMVFYLPLSSLYPLMTSGYFRLLPGMPVLWGAYVVGMMGAAFLFGSVLRIKRHIWAAYAGLLGIGIASAICGLLPPDMWAWWIFLFACGAMGACVKCHGDSHHGLHAKTIAPEKLGRAFFAYDAFELGGHAFGTARCRTDGGADWRAHMVSRDRTGGDGHRAGRHVLELSDENGAAGGFSGGPERNRKRGSTDENISYCSHRRRRHRPGSGERGNACAGARRPAGWQFCLFLCEFPWGCDYYLKNGRMMPEDGMERLAGFDAILLGGWGIPACRPHLPLGSASKIRKGFDQYVNLRPVRLLSGAPCPLKGVEPGQIDMLFIRENSEGEYAGSGSWLFRDTPRR